MRVIAANHPLRDDLVDLRLSEGLTLSEILEQSQPDPILRAHAHIFVGDVRVPRQSWGRVRPKPGAVVTIRVVAQGGGGGKNPLRTILTIAVVVAAAAVTGGAAAGLLGSAFAGGTIGAAALGAGVSIAGNMLVNAIAPIRPPSMGGLSGSQGRDSPTLSIEGARNAARPFGVVPAVLGRHRHVPPLAAQTYTEIIGDEQYLRMLVVWGYGPLKIEDLRIGETPIGDFDGVLLQNREGRPDDEPITVYPDDVTEETLGITLKQEDSWSTRVSAPDTDELSMDLVLPGGLYRFTDEGKRVSRSVVLEVRYRMVGDTEWQAPPFTETLEHYVTRTGIVGYTTHDVNEDYSVRRAVYGTIRELSWVQDGALKLTHRRTSAIRHGFRWPVPQGQYEVRVRRTTADTTDSKIADTVQWTALRSFSNRPPIQFAHNLAVTAISIQATNQLNQVIDQLTATVTSIVPGWDGQEVATSNPALLYRHVLQGPANARRLTDERVDLEGLQSWGEYCDSEGFEFNMIRDFESSVWDTLADVATSGRASPSQRNGKWGVTVDQPQEFPVQHLTPRNSWGFEAEKAFPDPPHAFRVRFSNRDKGYRQDERIVYADGYDESNAEVFESLDAPGITDPEHIWRFARFHLAQGILRPERWNLNLDFEHLVARRGSLVRITHDVLLVGLASGRIKSLITEVIEGDELITGIISDEVLAMEAGKDYGVSIRAVSDAGVSRQLVTVPGEHNEVMFEAPLPLSSGVSAGDLFGYGIAGQEYVEGLVLSIEPEADLVARLVLIPYSPAVYTSDQGEIPPYDSGLTQQTRIPDAMIAGVRSDESVLQLGSGNTLIPHISVSVESIDMRGASLDAQIRPSGTGEPYYNAAIVAREGSDLLISGVDEGESYDIRVRWNEPNRLPGRWAYANGHRVIGQSTPPSGLEGIDISAFGGSALIRWDRPPELDVRYGGEVRFRHSPALNADNATWASSTSIGDTARGDALLAQLPLKPGTYLARVFDRGGRPSPMVAKISTKQASVLEFAQVDSVTESPSFPGENSGTSVADGSLMLASSLLFDDIEDFDSIASLDYIGGVAISGTYGFAGGFDLGSVRRVRLTSIVDATCLAVLDLIDDRTDNVDIWEDWDGTQQAQADARVQVRHTDEDPNVATEWSVWNNLDSAEFFARGFEFRARLSSNDPAYNIRVDDLGVVAEEFV